MPWFASKESNGRTKKNSSVNCSDATDSVVGAGMHHQARQKPAHNTEVFAPDKENTRGAHAHTPKKKGPTSHVRGKPAFSVSLRASLGNDDLQKISIPTCHLDWCVARSQRTLGRIEA